MKRLVNLLRKTAFMDLEDEHRYDAMAGAVTIHSGGLSTVNGGAQFAQTFASHSISSPPPGQDISSECPFSVLRSQFSVLSSQCFVVNSDMHFDKPHPNANSHRRFLAH
jgi:hypothetical protein